MFEDAEFLPSEAWLMSESKGIEDEKLGQICWRRPNEFMKNKYDLFDNENTSDMLQAKEMRQEIITSLFINNAISLTGKYKVRLFLQESWQTIEIDDQIPILKNTQKPLFLSHNGSLIWPLLIEKAWAKAHGGYGRLQMGSMREALVGLTGSPCDSMQLEELDPQDIWEILTESSFKGYSMTCGSKEKINNQDKTEQTLGKSDIKSSHAFSLVSLVNDGSIKAIKLWNPWGKSFLEKEPHERNSEEVEKGSSLMSFDQFLENFNSLSVCMTGQANFKSVLENEQKSNKMVFFQLKVKQQGHIYISACIKQPAASGVASSEGNISSESSATSSSQQSCSTPKYEQLTAVLAKWQSKKQEYLFVKSVQTKENEAIISSVCNKSPLSPGNYVLSFKAEWPNAESQTTKTALITCFGQSQVKISVIPPISHFLRSVALSIARQNWKHISPNHWISIGQIGEGYCYIAAANVKAPSQNEQISNANAFLCRFKIRNPKQFKLKKPFSSNVVNFRLLPGECDVAILRCKNPQDASSLNISQHFQF